MTEEIRLVWFPVAFLAGSFPTAYLVGKHVFHSDIRTQGSGNVGATNAFRVFGKGAGAAVFAADFLKGFLPVIAYARFVSADPADTLWIGLAAVLGHVFTPFLRFKGGKGIATGSGALAAALPLLFALTLPVWVVVFAFTRIVSISSLAALAGLFFYTFLFHLPPRASMAMLVILSLAVWTHRSNIARLRSGTEKKL
ncbi:MAG TPA: glycerol-3-phosphate 1-O-acyltransferase PlsY [Candidatus Eisenbacteria bacterium]|nr:glycerol-3-phosphate 1-O-acyltransferase PlsY [Candidatus Eisenbacteria bacterium]